MENSELTKAKADREGSILVGALGALAMVVGYALGRVTQVSWLLFVPYVTHPYHQIAQMLLFVGCFAFLVGCGAGLYYQEKCEALSSRPTDKSPKPDSEDEA